MANPLINLHHHVAAVLLVCFLVISSSPSCSSARLLNKDLSLAATEPTFNLALPSDGVVRVPVQQKEDPTADGHVSACEGMTMRVRAMRLGGAKYESLIFERLPKGTVPPSGPSRGGNDINN